MNKAVLADDLAKQRQAENRYRNIKDMERKWAEMPSQSQRDAM